MHKVLIVGHSHANCIVAALRSPIDIEGDVVFEVVAAGSKGLVGGLVLTNGAGKRVVNPILLHAADRAGNDPGVDRISMVSLIGGNHALQLGLFTGSRPWHVAGSNGATSLAQSVPVPYQALKAAVSRRLASFGEFMRLLPRGVFDRILHVEAPPPVFSARYIFETLPAKARELALQAGLPEVSVSDIAAPEHRKRVWLCQSEVVRDLVEGSGAEYLLPPASAIDAQGYLREEFRKDPSHGNASYGREVIKMVAATLGEHEVAHGP